MDLSIVHYINHLWEGTIVDTLSLIISLKLFLALLWVVVVVLVTWKCKKNRKIVLLAFLFSILLFFVIWEWWFKMSFPYIRWLRLRPYLAHPDLIHPIGNLYTDTSFPSSHMANVLALFTVVVCFIPRVWPIALWFAVMMAFSRMHNGMHYPTDVIVGALRGILYGLVAVWLAKKIIRKI